jgi:molybdate transport system permease protein
VEAVVALPLVLPRRFSVLRSGVWVPERFRTNGESLFGQTLPFTLGGLLVASVLYSLPSAVQPFSAAFAAVDRRLVEAAWTLGGSGPRTFLSVIVAAVDRRILSGVVLSFVHTIGEFRVVLMVEETFRV